MLFTQMPSFFEALQADFGYLRRSPTKRPRETYHRMFTDPTRDWPRVACSCEQTHAALPDDTATGTPKKSSTFTSTRPSLTFEERREEPEKLTTTIVESTDPDSDEEVDEIRVLSPHEEEKFTAHLNLDQFAPNEISVEVLEDCSRKRTLEVRGKHCATNDEDDPDDEYECLEYVKRLSLPHGVQSHQLRCTLDQDGHMAIEAPIEDVVAVVPVASAQRTIPVQVIDSAHRTEHSRKAKRSRLDSELIVIE